MREKRERESVCENMRDYESEKREREREYARTGRG